MSSRQPNPPPEATDIIGDIHGYSAQLYELLHELGYRRSAAGWQHPRKRQAVFVGDLIDGGPDPRGVLETVSTMMESGHARCVMGNHEYNALLHYLPGPDGTPLKAMSRRQLASHESTWRALAGPRPQEWQAWLQWMHQLPLWLDAGPFRVVHACWDHNAVAFLIQSRLTGNLLRSSAQPGSEQEAIGTLLKGPILKQNPDGNPESRPVRLRWWQPLQAGMPLRQASVDPLSLESGNLILQEQDIPDAYPPDAAPLFVGHYNGRGGSSMELAPNVICVDAGIAHGRKLAAYRVDQSLAHTI